MDLVASKGSIVFVSFVPKHLANAPKVEILMPARLPQQQLFPAVLLRLQAALLRQLLQRSREQQLTQ